MHTDLRGKLCPEVYLRILHSNTLRVPIDFLALVVCDVFTLTNFEIIAQFQKKGLYLKIVCGKMNVFLLEKNLG